MRKQFTTAASLYIFLTSIRDGINDYAVNASLDKSKKEIIDNVNALIVPLLDMEPKNFFDPPSDSMIEIFTKLSPFIMDFFRLINGKTPEQTCHNYENRIYKFNTNKGEIPVMIRFKTIKDPKETYYIRIYDINKCRPSKFEELALVACGQIVEFDVMDGLNHVVYG